MVVEKDLLDANLLKEEGNEKFKCGEFDKAIECYSKAIKLVTEDSQDLAVFLKNRAAAYLKKNEYEKVIADCTAALQIVPTDPKTLFRRAQALESVERFEEAYRDARGVLSAEPSNKAIQSVLQRLHPIVQERARKNAQTSTKVSQMFELAFDIAGDKEKRETAMSNLLVLSRERAGSEVMYKEGVVAKIGKLLKVEKNSSIYVNAVRVIGELCKKSIDRTKGIIKELGIPWFLDILNCSSEAQVHAAQNCMQIILNTFSGMENKPDTKPVKELCEAYHKEIDTLLTCLVYSITNRVISGMARDAIIELLIRNIHYTTLNWAERLIETRGLIRLMEVCSELEEYKYESCMNITPSSRTIASVCLARVYENMYYDELRERFMEQIDEYIKDKLLTPDIESKVRVTVAITALLLGPLDVGNAIISKEGIMEMILVMAGTDDDLQQKVACECIIAASSKKDKAKSIISQGVNILKRLYQSKNDGVRVRALVGLCKLGSSGGSDASIRPFADGATTKLAEACRRFLINPDKDPDMRRWAAEGLSYLTLDAEVKEKLVEDRAAVQALIELAKTGNQTVLYGVVTTLVNICNAYEKQEVLPEMMELAKFAKQHVPEEHELDDPDFIAKRLVILANEGVTTALVALSKTESDNSKELIARVFNAVCSQQELRGIVVQQGGTKVLIPLALNGTKNGKKQAAQAVSRIGITINPEVAFPGQRNLEVIRPLLSLLHPECTALENFEALMALCNLAGLNESVRQRIVKEGGISLIEAMLFEDHLMIRRAATQVLTNMVISPDVVKMFEGENDRTKFLFLLCMEEDEDTAMAAAGAIAMLTSESSICCKKLLLPESWLDVIHCLLANPNQKIQHRGLYIVLNMIQNDKEVAEKLMLTDVMEILMALTKIEDNARNIIKEFATKCLKAAEDLHLIKKPTAEELPNPFLQNPDEDEESD